MALNIIYADELGNYIFSFNFSSKMHTAYQNLHLDVL